MYSPLNLLKHKDSDDLFFLHLKLKKIIDQYGIENGYTKLYYRLTQIVEIFMFMSGHRQHIADSYIKWLRSGSTLDLKELFYKVNINDNLDNFNVFETLDSFIKNVSL